MVEIITTYMKKISKKFLILSAVFILALPVAYAIDTISEGFKNTPGLTQSIDAHGVCKKVVNGTSDTTYFVPTNTSTEWQAFRDNTPVDISLDDCIQTINLVINSPTPNYNIANSAGNPSVPVNVILTVNSTVYSANTGSAALTTGSFTNGSTVEIINNGSIIGAGGAAGNGANFRSSVNGGNGGPGGDAISLNYNVEIQNSGIIGGGGGGGGGGGAVTVTFPIPTSGAAGGGGSGGRGFGSLGYAGSGSGVGTILYATNGRNASLDTSYVGGAGARAFIYNNESYSIMGGYGGDGGALGNRGGDGTSGWIRPSSPATNGTVSGGGGGGNPGNAVRENGFSASITGGTVLGLVN